jgi:hypothetical protein
MLIIQGGRAGAQWKGADSSIIATPLRRSLRFFRALARGRSAACLGLVSRPSAASACASGTRAGTQGRHDWTFQLSIGFAVWPLGPGSSLADARSAGTREQCPPHAPFLTQQCQTAQCSSFPRRVSAPGFVFHPFAPGPEPRGGRSADRRSYSVVARARRD